VLLCLVASACTAGPGQGRTPAATPTTASASTSDSGPATLRFAVYGEPGVVAAYRQMASTYTHLHPQITVKVEAVADAVTADDRLDREFASGTAPDLFLTRQTSLPELVADQRVQPVDELLEARGVQFGDHFQRLGLEGFAADSALQCMPNDVSPYVVYYNRRMLSPRTLALPGERPPSVDQGWTWEQFVAAAQQLSHDGVKGVSLAARLDTLIPLVRSAGADLVDDPRRPTTLTFADDSTRAALVKSLTVARDPSISPTLAQLTQEDAVSRFENGRVGMILGTRALVPALRAKAGLRFDVFPLPSLGLPRTLAEMTGYCIAKDSAHLPQAADFLAFASGPRGSRILAGSGAVVPANIEALHSPDFLQPDRLPRTGVVFSDVMRAADPAPSTPGWPEVVSQTQPLVDRMFYSPVLDLDTLLARIDEVSVPLLVQPTLSPSPSPSQ
jgi:multiple sugar transport system substrate-binding protein